jgi:hypothetical protein
MKSKFALVLAVMIIGISYGAKSRNDDDSIKYVAVQNVHLPNETCNQGWAAMVNTSGRPGGPNRNIRVYYTMNNRPMVCKTKPLPQIPDPKQIYTLLGCWGGSYVITRSEYIP